MFTIFNTIISVVIVGIDSTIFKQGEDTLAQSPVEMVCWTAHRNEVICFVTLFD